MSLKLFFTPFALQLYLLFYSFLCQYLWVWWFNLIHYFLKYIERMLLISTSCWK